jgi:FkbH-like protein
MKLADALRILQRDATVGVEPFEVYLACGCTPLHLATFLAAHLRLREPARRVHVETGRYGDCLGNIHLLRGSGKRGGAVVLEWSDFDPRLGLRHLGGWTRSVLDDILETVGLRAAHFREAIGLAAGLAPVAVCLPTLAIPPLSHTPLRQSGAFDLRLHERVGALAAAVGDKPGVRLVNRQRLDVESPPGERLDVRSELATGFPYRIPHASALAGMLATLIDPPPPKKGLITDLDNTLWRGVLGELGPRGISWDLDRASHAHALYQQFLASLADAGVLLAVASKNDSEAVDEAFRREDLILPRERVYPVEAHWEPKSGSVSRILRAWNVGADSVVFVDDSPAELAEVAASYPGVECLAFPKDDDGVYELIGRLRELFGKERLGADDEIRLDSIRRSAPVLEAVERDGDDPEVFLSQAGAVLALNDSKVSPDPRLLELVNKTNQFNLNGVRFTEAAWGAYLGDPDSFLISASYRDKYSPLGTIAVLAGRRRGGVPVVDVWVMSCRAFCRRIEYRCLEQLFGRLGTGEIAFDIRATAKNKPIREFLTTLTGTPPEPGLVLPLDTFTAQCPPLYHKIEVLCRA